MDCLHQAFVHKHSFMIDFQRGFYDLEIKFIKCYRLNVRYIFVCTCICVEIYGIVFQCGSVNEKNKCLIFCVLYHLVTDKFKPF